MMNCLAMFGVLGRDYVRAYFELARSFHEPAEDERVVVSLSGRGVPKKPISLPVALARLDRDLASIRSAEIYTQGPNDEYLSTEWRRASMVQLEEGVVAFARERPLDAPEIRRIASPLAERIAYGYVYARTLERGPVLYDVGLGCGLGYSGEDKVESNEIGRWMRELNGARRHLAGLLRDVYPINLLSSVHRERQVSAGVDFETWIKASDERGVLESLVGDLSCWRVPDPKLIRTQLVEMGMLISPAPR